MSYARDPNIPTDPKENLKRLQSINKRWTEALDRKRGKIQTLDERISNMTEPEDACHQAVLMHNRNDLMDEIEELEGKLESNERLQGIVEDVIAKQGDLTHQPFAKLADED